MNIPRKRRFPYRPITPVKRPDPYWLKASLWLSKTGTYPFPPNPQEGFERSRQWP